MFDVILSIVGILVLIALFVALFGYLLLAITESRAIRNETDDNDDIEDWKLHSYPIGEKEITITDNQKTDK